MVKEIMDKFVAKIKEGIKNEKDQPHFYGVVKEQFKKNLGKIKDQVNKTLG